MTLARRHPSTWVAVVCYLGLAIAIFVEQIGRTTSDTRLDLTENPVGFLRSSLTLWNPRVSFGELQNQAYGYLFPHGTFFAAAELMGVAGWVTQRAWSILVLVIACEGMRRLVLALRIGPWPALVAGLAYGLSPRMVGEIGVRSAEILPTAAIPWVALPVVLVATGRMGLRTGALLSGAAFACSGGVNGTATVAPLPLVMILVGWAVLSCGVPRRFALWWAGSIALASLWWVVSLLRLGAFSPPFYNYVEDAPTTTSTSGFAPALRAANNWVNYIVVAEQSWWPAGYAVGFDPWVVAGSAVVAALGLLGLVRYRGLARGPLLASAALGMVCLTIAHTSAVASPLAPWVQDLLDGPLAPLRNVHKADPLLRVPLAVGVAAVLAEVVRALSGPARTSWRRRRRRSWAGGSVAVLVATALVAMATPILVGETRTPGWRDVPDHWTQTVDFLDAEPGEGAAWLLPGTGFGIQSWGWTMEEPLQVLGERRWVTRSQVPLVPAATLRMLTAWEGVIETGSGSPYLASALARAGVSHVVVRHDLDEAVTDAPLASVVVLALARSRGIRRVAAFGRAPSGFGPATEVFRVGDGDPPRYRIGDVEDAVAVAGGVEDTFTAVGSGVVEMAAPMVLQGDRPAASGAEAGLLGDEGAVLLGDGFRRRERNFGRIHDAETAVLTAGEALTGGRVVPNYPGPPGTEPVVAEPVGYAGITASSSRGHANVLGPVRGDHGPHAVLDGQPGTTWQAAYFSVGTEQWLEIDLGRERRLGVVEITSPFFDRGTAGVTEWDVLAGGRTFTADADGEGRARLDLTGVRAASVRLAVAGVTRAGPPVAVSEVALEGITTERTLRVPEVPLRRDAELLFTALPERRSCVPTLLGPDCSEFRGRAPEEAAGLDRTFTLPEASPEQDYEVRATAVARARPGTADLLDPLTGPRVEASSWFGLDPLVSPRRAHDGDPTSSWLADPRDPTPTLTVRWDAPVRLSRLYVAPPADPGRVPTRVVLRTPAGERREIDLNGAGTFDPVRTDEVELALSREDADPRRPLGVSELVLAPGSAEAPLDQSGPTGSVCGFGPVLEVSGRTYPTRVSGVVGDVLNAGRMEVETCGPGRRPDREAPRIRLGPGENRVQLRATEQFSPVSLRLSPVISDRREAIPARRLAVVDETSTEQVLRVSDGPSAVLSTARNHNDGWEATLDGRALRALRVDGWAQGWHVPAGDGGTLRIVYAPHAGFRLTLVGGLVLLGLLLVAAAGAGVRHLRRSRPGGRPRHARLPRTLRRSRREMLAGASARTRLLTAVVAVGAGFLLGGPAVAGGLAAGVLLHRFPRVLTAAAVLALAGGVVAVVLDATTGRLPGTAPDVFVGVGIGLAVVLAFVPSAGAGADAGADVDPDPAGRRA